MGAFILAAIIFVGICLLWLLIAFADGDSQTHNPILPFVSYGGFTLAALVASSHWWPHIGW
jgi:uncharacterized membrane protein